MTRYACKRDDNHAPIRDALRALGVVVVDTGSAGGGLPDLVCLHVTAKDPVTGSALVRLLEVKDGDKSPSRRKLTKAQIEFTKWIPVIVVKDLDEAKKAVGVKT